MYSGNPSMRAASGYNMATRGRNSTGTTSWPWTNLDAPPRALTRGTTLSSSFFDFATYITNVTISSAVVPLGIPKLAASWEILAGQRCGAPRGLNATVSRTCRYVQPSGICFRRQDRSGQQMDPHSIISWRKGRTLWHGVGSL